VETRKAWIVAAASGWALAIFAGGVLVGGALDDDDSKRVAPEAQDAREETRGAQRSPARDGEPATGGPVRVSLSEVRGELVVGQRGRRGGRGSRRGGGGSREAGGGSQRARPAGGGAPAGILAGRRGTAAIGVRPVAAPPPAVRRAPARPRRRGSRRVRRRAHRAPRRGRPPAPPAAPLAPALPPPPSVHRGRGHGDRDEDEDEDEDDNEDEDEDDEDDD
jgi:hypothetical protein